MLLNNDFIDHKKSSTIKNDDSNIKDNTTIEDSSSNKVKGRLMQNPNKNHKSESYDDLKLDFSAELFSSLENYLPKDILNTSRDNKVKYMYTILHDYLPPETQYRVEHFEKWVNTTNFQVIRPTTMNKFGVVLDDFGFQTMFDKLMEGFICPLSKVLFAKVGGSTLDFHHGFVVEYGIDKDVDLGFHVDDSEVTLNVCLGKQFSGGELFFRGIRCEKHMHTKSHPEENFDYFHIPGQAVLHHGRHRHGARATTWGHRVNLILWCKR
ncbi:hypothetical protein PHAVU_002G326100 [Phaseolus vulgaris]|uniref:Fe2OG dioxygenase domain-containing protein n=1 Tax=Phaseolus vulgaris TaxID=3885 RepID=V7CQT9_PHAVU|nr:hypothetical protein PHAVU_002G326100g [Phaseolus vulgaris]ESW32484.1 hypothetical protein PHAVU_002G326100g [Phaseolus vulgaris]